MCISLCVRERQEESESKSMKYGYLSQVWEYVRGMGKFLGGGHTHRQIF